MSALALLGVEGKFGDVLPFHSEAKFALDEGADEERKEVQSEQCLDAALVFEEDGCNLVHRLDLLEAFFDHRLTLVSLQDFGR